MRIGIHTSIAGSLEKAALKAAELGANTFQIFSASPRMWRAAPPDPAHVRLLKKARERHDLFPLAIHANYLINLASCDEALRTISATAFRGEMERALTIGAEYLVVHPGNCKGYSVEEGIVSVVRSLAESARHVKTAGLTVLLENTAGSGNALGSKFEELAMMRKAATEFTDLAVGFCIDTCHCLASGYDVATPAGLRKTVEQMDGVLGLENVPVIHANDSKTPLNSRVDRHANIGEGYIGEAGFCAILTHSKLRAKAFLLETPVNKEGDDQKNVDALKRLCRKKRSSS